MANVLFSRTSDPSSKPITDGQLVFDTSGNGKMYLDNGTERLEMGGSMSVDSVLNAESTNPIQNKAVAGVMLKTLDEVGAVTKAGFIPDALTVKQLNSNLDIDFSNASSEVQNVHTLLQNLLDKFYPAFDGYRIIQDGDIMVETVVGNTNSQYPAIGTSYKSDGALIIKSTASATNESYYICSDFDLTEYKKVIVEYGSSTKSISTYEIDISSKNGNYYICVGHTTNPIYQYARVIISKNYINIDQAEFSETEIESSIPWSANKEFRFYNVYLEK